MDSYYELKRDNMRRAIASPCENDTFPTHFHGSVELMYVLRGELTATQERCELPLTAGALFINSPYLLHGFHTPEYSSVIVVPIPLGAIPSLKARLGGRRFKQSVYKGACSHDVLRLVRMMVRAGENAELCNALACALLLMLMECVGLTEPVAPVQPDLLRGVLQYVQEHLTEDLSVPVLSRALGYSESRVSHLFRERVGCTLSRYVGSLRCRYARALLETGEATVLDAALRAGFGNVRTFYRAYRREFGGTPRAR